jgi:hypothetical protein
MQFVEHGVGQRHARAQRRRASLGARERFHDFARIRVEQELVRVEAVAFGRPPRAMHPKAVDEAGAHVGQLAVPHVLSGCRQAVAGQFVQAAGVEHAQVHRLGVG